MSIPVCSITRHPEEEEEAIEHVYDVIIFSNELLTTVTHHPDAVTRWINAVNAHEHTGVRRIGFEFEVDPHANRIGTVQLLVQLLQVGTLRRRCLVFQLPADAALPTSLDEFLANRNNCFVGVDITAKMNRLRRQCPFEASPVHCLDLFPILQWQGTSDSETTSVEITDWVNPILSLDHLLFACTDVFMKTSGML